jgi:hypothetical protein
MKTVLVIVMSLIGSFLIAQAPKFEVDNAVHKFADTREGELLSHVFTIKNTGDTPLIISDYKVACPCTKVELPSNPILPGKTYQMKVTFDTKGKFEWQDRAILLQTNTKRKEEKLRIKVFVIPEKK